MFLGVVLGACIVAPSLIGSNSNFARYLPFSSVTPMDNHVSTTGYKFQQLLQPLRGSENLQENRPLIQQRYDEYSEPFLPAMGIVAVFFSFVAVTAVLVHVGLFHLTDIWNWLKPKPMHHHDVHTRTILSHYAPVPLWWHGVLFVVCFVMGIVALHQYRTECPVWALPVALLLAVLFIVPIGIIQGMTAISISLRHFVCLIAGRMFQKMIPVAIFSMFSHGVVTQALLFAGGCKLGHYFKIPPRITFMAQISAQLVVSLVNATMWSLALPNLNDKNAGGNNNKWFAYTQDMLYWGAVGPHRAFLHRYSWTLWGFLIGAILPIAT